MLKRKYFVQREAAFWIFVAALIAVMCGLAWSGRRAEDSRRLNDVLKGVEYERACSDESINLGTSWSACFRKKLREGGYEQP